MARTLEVLVRAGAKAAEKSQEVGLQHPNLLVSSFLRQEGSDLGRAAYFLDSEMVREGLWILTDFEWSNLQKPLNCTAAQLFEVGVLVTKVLKPNSRAASRALNGALLGISQLKHRVDLRSLTKATAQRRIK